MGGGIVWRNHGGGTGKGATFGVLINKTIKRTQLRVALIPRSKWPTQNELNDIFVDILSLLNIFELFFVLLIVCIYSVVSDFVFSDDLSHRK